MLEGWHAAPVDILQGWETLGRGRLDSCWHAGPLVAVVGCGGASWGIAALGGTASGVDAPTGGAKEATNSAARLAMLLQPLLGYHAFQMAAQMHVEMALHTDSVLPTMMVVGVCAGATRDRTMQSGAGRQAGDGS